MPRKKRDDDDLQQFIKEAEQTPSLSKADEEFLRRLQEPSEAILFAEGKEFLESQLDVVIMPDATASSTCYLAFLSKASPGDLPGITHPPGFYYGEPLSSERYNQLLNRWRTTLAEMPSVAHAKFWFPVLATSRTAVPDIEKYVARLLKLDSVWQDQFEGVQGYEQGICIEPDKAMAKQLVPRAFIPEANWFSEDIRALKPSDIITLMPEAELLMFMLFLGRTACGRANSMPIGWDEILSHQFRKMAILYGKDPRTGKSTTCGAIIRALKLLGYHIANFRGLGQRFNMGPIYTSDLAFKDDATQASAEALLEREATKMLISGASMMAEDKGKDAFNITPTCTVLFITNALDQNVLFRKDAGIVDRLAILYTYSSAELSRLDVEVCIRGEVQRSPNPRPYEHLNWLSAQLDTSPEVLMMWVLRQSAEYFLEQLRANQLERTISELTDRLRFPICHQVLPNVISAMLLSVQLRHPGTDLVDLTNKKTLAYVLNAFAYVVADLDAHIVRCKIKDDWNDKGRPSLHPWHGIKLISKVCISNLLECLGTCLSNSQLDLDEMIKLCFSKLQTTQGINVGSSKYYVKRSWSDIVGTAMGDGLSDLARQICEEHEAIDVLVHAHSRLIGDGLASMSYTEEIGYNSDKVATVLHGMYEDALQEDIVLDFTKSYTNWLREQR